MVLYIFLCLFLVLLVIAVGGFFIAVIKIDLDFASFDYHVEPMRRWDRPFKRTGDADLPYSVHMKGKAFRWQQPERVFRGNEFYKMFEDGPWKWAAQGRFAGKDLNCGHYFGLSVEAATEEAAHYGMHPEAAVLIEIEGESGRILDLTHPDVIKSMFETYVDNHQVVSWSYYTMFQELIELGNGGNPITDYLGYRAKRDGYHGLLFFSSRILKEFASYRAYDRDLEGLTYKHEFWRLRTNPKNLNIVLFSGFALINGIKTIRIGEGLPMENPYFGIGLERISSMFPEHDDYYQLEHDRFLLTKPRYIGEVE